MHGILSVLYLHVCRLSNTSESEVFRAELQKDCEVRMPFPSYPSIQDGTIFILGVVEEGFALLKPLFPRWPISSWVSKRKRNFWLSLLRNIGQLLLRRRVRKE